MSHNPFLMSSPLSKSKKGKPTSKEPSRSIIDLTHDYTQEYDGADSDIPSNAKNVLIDEGKQYECICGGRAPQTEWIQCEDPDCTISWYHLFCAGLSEAPEGEWICSRCQTHKQSSTMVESRIRPSPVFPNLVPDSRLGQQESSSEVSKERKEVSVKKGVAMKKTVLKEKAPKALNKPTWKGWKEVSEAEEKSLKRKANNAWEESVPLPKRRQRTREIREESSESDVTPIPRRRLRRRETLEQPPKTDDDDEIRASAQYLLDMVKAVNTDSSGPSSPAAESTSPPHTPSYPPREPGACGTEYAQHEAPGGEADGNRNDATFFSPDQNPPRKTVGGLTLANWKPWQVRRDS